MNKISKSKTLFASISIACLVAACNSTSPENKQLSGPVPADKFDLSHWKITMPLDEDNNSKIDEIDVKDIQTYSHPDFFYLDENGHMVFTVPNKATTTSGSSNTRSELRQMFRGLNTKIGTHDPGNNFTLAVNPIANKYAAVGGKMEATLKVNAVSLRAGYPEKRPAYSVVVGQIHADKNKKLQQATKGKGDFGWGNEPIKIYYKKWPNHDKGSVFWNYERNLTKDDPNRTDIAYPVWGNVWTDPADPGAEGISLGEEFSYVINVHENIMYLTFTAEGHPEVKYEINLANNVDAYGKPDPLDNPWGYAYDGNYFKAGAYNQCSTKDDKAFWYTACPGTGIWATDKANGDYTSVAFSKLVISESTPPKK
ncbi:polysaccharide lyase family 7 protein [Colwellia sp. E2M01]|uniref:polysaccharide lyase family 7 protein n=1 Tax=Colwellia sp. E2M01 TaxID=2841561 RepID=UPI001C0A63D3|nr:polysaccharide lyase family 7 protein [Colwellia sp. E2M01]MBU2869456.1 polysaccharide lyase family 7 protein [Colwellia sp. E2M01]